MLCVFVLRYHHVNFNSGGRITENEYASLIYRVLAACHWKSCKYPIDTIFGSSSPGESLLFLPFFVKYSQHRIQMRLQDLAIVKTTLLDTVSA